MEPDAPLDVPLPFELPRPADDRIGRRIWGELLIEARYDGYLKREASEIQRLETWETLPIPADFDYAALDGLSNESRQKLLKVQPKTLGQAGRIDGVTPVDLALIQIHLKKKEKPQ